MRKFGLIGYPLGHSFSKKYFSDKFIREGIHDCLYENYPIDTIEKLPGLLITEPLLTGLNVTIPFKSQVIKYLDYVDPEASAIGAVNVLKIARPVSEPVITGYNSDFTGFRESLKPLLNEGITNALVLGTGGSSRAVCYALATLGIEYRLVSRKNSGDCLGYTDLDPGIIKSHRLIINTTPLGMFPDVERMPDLDYNSIGPGHILFDLVYNPEMTAFLWEGHERGATIKNGLEMLKLQAERSWEIWNEDLG